MSNSRVFQRWQERQKAATIKMLKLLIKRIESGQLIVNAHGMWTSKLDSKVFFRVDVISQDSHRIIEEFREK